MAKDAQRSVLLTGATGLVGKAALPFLREAGFEVHALTRGGRGPETGINWINGDILDEKRVADIVAQIKPKFLLHFAWFVTGYFDSRANEDLVRGSLSMLRHFSEQGGKRAVFAGSYKEYGSADAAFLSEETPVQPIDLYGKCKNELNQAARAYCAANGVGYAWGRIFSVFGKERDQRRLTPDIVNSLREGKRVTIRSGNVVRDFIYSKDVAEAFVKFLDNDVQGTVNICTGIATPLSDYARQIARKLNAEHLLAFEDRNVNEMKRAVGDNRRLVQEAWFTPRYGIDAALDEILS